MPRWRGGDVALDIKHLEKNNVPRDLETERIINVCPGDTVASDIRDLDKKDMPETDALVGRSEQGVVMPGEKRASLPTRTAPIPKTRVGLEVELHMAYELGGMDKMRDTWHSTEDHDRDKFAKQTLL